MPSAQASGPPAAPQRRSPWDVSNLVPPNAPVNAVYTEMYTPVDPPPPLPSSLHAATPPQPPVIFHIVCPAGLTDARDVVTFISAHTPLAAPYVTELIEFGAVYVRKHRECARVSPRATRVGSADAWTALPRATPLYARVYANPKRHAGRTGFRVVRDAGGVVAVCKPAGLPMAASVDNAVECLARVVRDAVGAEVHVTSRLDVGTSGVALFGRTRAAGNAVNRMLRGARKRYVVWSDARPRAGRCADWYNKGARRGRGAVREALLWPGDEAMPAGRWVRAELVVESVRWCARRACWESVVLLVTGRTHQIRLQFAARGWAVRGDCKYAGVVGAVWKEVGGTLGADAEVLGLHAWKVEGVLEGNKVEWEVATELRGDG